MEISGQCVLIGVECRNTLCFAGEWLGVSSRDREEWQPVPPRLLDSALLLRVCMLPVGGFVHQTALTSTVHSTSEYIYRRCYAPELQ